MGRLIYRGFRRPSFTPKTGRLMAWPAFLALFGWFALSGCALADDRAPDYRDRLTVKAETPDGLRTGTSVIQVKQSLGRPGGAPANSQIYTRVRGEAAAMDLTGGQSLFALLRSERNIQWAGTTVSALTYRIVHAEGKPRFDGVLRLTREVEIPRRYPRNPRLGAYPMLVAIGDLNEPTGIMKVDPDDLAGRIGESVRLKRFTLA